jgi:hypothetical protein
MNMKVWRGTATLLLLFCSLLSPQAGRAQAMADQATDIGWPRQIQKDGNTIILYQPQIERWDGNQLQSRTAVAVETATAAQPTYGVIWLSARTEVDKERRLVTLEDCRIQRDLSHRDAGLCEPAAPALPPGPHTIALDRLQANLAVLAFTVLLTPTYTMSAERVGAVIFFSIVDLKKALSHPSLSSLSQLSPSFAWRDLHDQAYEEGPIERDYRWSNGLGFGGYANPWVVISW